MRFLRVVALAALVAPAAFAGFAVDLPLVAAQQGVSTRFYTSVDITNRNALSTDVAFEYIASDYSVDVAGTLIPGLAGFANFHTDDIIAYLGSKGFLTATEVANTKGTMLLTFLNPNFTTGEEASVTVRTYNFLTPGQAPSVGYAYSGFLLRREGAHTVSGTAGDTTAAGPGVPIVVTNLGIEHVGINDAGQVDTNPVAVQLTFTNPQTGAQVGPQPTINLQSGQVTQINNLWSTYGLPHSTASVLVSAHEITGTAHIRGYIILKDVSTNDGSLFFMQ